jgi:hypothetical protein
MVQIRQPKELLDPDRSGTRGSRPFASYRGPGVGVLQKSIQRHVCER